MEPLLKADYLVFGHFLLPEIKAFSGEWSPGGGVVHGSTAKCACDDHPTLDGVLTGGGEAFVACGPNFKPLACLVGEISAQKWFPIIPVCQGLTIGFRCEPAVCIVPHK